VILIFCGFATFSSACALLPGTLCVAIAEKGVLGEGNTSLLLKQTRTLLS